MAIYSVRGFGAGAMCFTGVPPCHQSVKLHMKLPTFLISISWFSKKKLWEIHLLLYLIYLFISIQHFWLPLFGFQVEFSGRFCPAFAPLLPRFCPALPLTWNYQMTNWFPSPIDFHRHSPTNFLIDKLRFDGPVRLPHAAFDWFIRILNIWIVLDCFQA